MGTFDGLPVPSDKTYLREELARIDESWVAARFDSLPHVVHILTSKDRETDILLLREQSDVVEEVVDEVVHAYHGGFNKAIQNYSQILRLFSESTDKIGDLKHDLAEAKRSLGTRNKQLHQLWYRSVTLRHIISLLDQIEGIAKVPSRIEKLIADKQFYAAIQVYLQSSLMLEREGLQTVVGALQDVRSELAKLRGALFFKILDDLHAHLYNRGEYSSVASSIYERDDEVPTTTAVAASRMSSQPLSRRTRTLKGDSQFGVRGLTNGSHRTASTEEGSSFDGHDEEDSVEHEEATGDGQTIRNGTDSKLLSYQLPPWLSDSSPDEFIEAVRKSDDPLHVKYLQTLVQCLCMLGKVAAAGAIICQRLRPTIHEIIISKIKAHMETKNLSKSACSQGDRTGAAGLHFIKGQSEAYRLSKDKPQNGTSNSGTHLAVSPVSPLMAPGGKAQAAAKDLLDSILDTIVKIFENHVVVGELLELRASQHDINTPKSLPTDVNWNADSEASQATGGYTISFPLTVLQSECQQLICEILRATPEAASADAAAQTAKLAKKAPKKDKRQALLSALVKWSVEEDASEDGVTFTFRFTDATVSISNQAGADLIRQGWGKRAPNSSQEGYGSAAVLPEQGMYLAASIYRPVLQFTDKITSMLPKKHSQLVNDGLLTFTENFVKDHLLPTMFVDYRKGVQQAISSAAAFRPRAHTTTYTPTVEKGRPILQGLLAIELLAKEVLGWAQAMPKFATDLVKYVQTFLERTFERCRTAYMEAVLEKLSYRLIGRHDIERLMRLDTGSACLPSQLGHSVSHSEAVGSEVELCELFLNLPSIKQDNLIRDDNKLILLASLSDSLEYVADSIERLGQAVPRAASQAEGNSRNQATSPRNLASFADEYRKLATDCLKVLRVEMQLETVFHLQEMTNREYLEDEDAEEPDDFVISLTSQITRRDEGMAPFISGEKRNYVFGGICGIAASASIKALADMRSINLFGVQQICRNTIALEQAMAAIPYVDGDSVQQNLDRVRTYYELLNMPFEALLAFIAEHDQMFTPTEYSNLLKVNVPGRDTPSDAQIRLSEILSH
uniref:Exocyst complex component Sec8 n=1 Tax=Brassica oleracea TaxID=3712 RepID=A0A3P6F3A9_BRAOL|nr:unnamed protein product [Brassica oleracea]